MNNKQTLTNDIVTITSIGNQTAIIIARTSSTAENSYTSLGGAIGTVQTTEELNKLINEATKQSQQNMPTQMPNFHGVEQAQITKIQSSCSIPQTTQNIPTQPVPERHTQKQSYSRPHSKTKTASPKQQDLIQTVCREKSKDLNSILAPYNKALSQLTSDEANTIIQKITKKVSIICYTLLSHSLIIFK